MKRNMLHIDTTLVEKYSEDEMLILCGGAAEARAFSLFGLDIWCTKENSKNCKCNKGCN